MRQRSTVQDQFYTTETQKKRPRCYYCVCRWPSLGGGGSFVRLEAEGLARTLYKSSVQAAEVASPTYIFSDGCTYLAKTALTLAVNRVECSNLQQSLRDGKEGVKFFLWRKLVYSDRVIFGGCASATAVAFRCPCWLAVKLATRSQTKIAIIQSNQNSLCAAGLCTLAYANTPVEGEPWTATSATACRRL